MTNKKITSEEIEHNYTTNTISEDCPDDLYFTSAGFEERTLVASETLDPEYEAELGIIYVNSEYFNRPNSEKTEKHLEELQDTLDQFCETVDVIMGSWLEADEQLHTLRDALGELSNKDPLRVTIDVTSFNREALFVSFNILQSLTEDITTRILYVSPEEYGDWLTEGHRKTRNIIGFAGMQNTKKPTLLIILSGFEEMRTLNTIEEVEPAKAMIGTGDPPLKESFLDKNEQNQEAILNRQDTERFEFPADSVNDSYQCIRDLISENVSDYNIILSPMSTKLSTLGTWKAANQFPEVQVIYTIPAKYNLENYSSGYRSMHVELV